MRPFTPAERDGAFAAKVEPCPTTGCWLWTASTIGRMKYGCFHDGRRKVYAHRWAYGRFVGPVPEGQQLDHTCRNPRCVNPAHLEPVTNKENVLRGEGITARNARKTHCKRGHHLSGANLYVKATGGRRCRECEKNKHQIRASQ